MTEPTFERLFENLQSTVARLSASADEQTQYLDRLGVSPLTDELALEFDDFYLAVVGRIQDDSAATTLVEQLGQLDRALKGPALSWEVEDLGSDSGWARIRQIAADCLRMMQDYVRHASA